MRHDGGPAIQLGRRSGFQPGNMKGTRTMRHTSIAPEAFTNVELATAIMALTNVATGLGRQLAMQPREHGWDIDNALDHDGMQAIVDAAVAAATKYAKDNRRFFNKEKLEDNALDAMVEAYRDGWNKQKEMIATGLPS